MQILIVDDDSAASKTIKAYLSGFNYCIHTATTSIDAIHLHFSHNYDVIFVGLNSPNLNAVALIQQIRIYNARKNFIPIIGLLPNPKSLQNKTYSSAGVNDYLIKPIQKPQLQAILAKYSKTIAPCEFLTPWYKPGALYQIRTGGKVAAVHP